MPWISKKESREPSGKDLADEGADHRSERGTDDDRDGQIDDVAAQDELFEPF